jgi:hypothetical protein
VVPKSLWQQASMRSTRIALCTAFLALAACGDEPASNDQARLPPAADAANAVSTQTAPACPFRSTSGWAGSVENGRLLVTGRVDLMMAGFRPQLSPRPGSAGGTLTMDLALAPAPGAPVNDRLRYEKHGAPNYRRGEIWCGGERIATFDVVVVG